MRRYGRFCGMLFLAFTACRGRPGKLFLRLDEAETGLSFNNVIRTSEDANVLNYAYFYNGAGVAAADFNNDGLTDLVFTGNMVPNRIYLNRGNFRFEDITEESGIAAAQGWCTGVSIADVNGDGRPDIYLCRSGDSDPARRRNLLYLNVDGRHFREAASEYGIADEGYSTQAVFFDYDRDGDLDLFLANHSLQKYANGEYDNTKLRRENNPAFGDKLYRNDGGHFTDVTAAAGIRGNVLCFGLGVCASDINGDGWPDIFVSNDFNEPDYLFLNNGHGGFTESLGRCFDETSLFSMGCDAADYNNDGRVDLVTLDMLPPGNHAQKMHLGAENYDKFAMLFAQGIAPQYMRNMLQKNNGDGTFSEVGRMAGISATDWSWSALFSDLDLDGKKDLFVTNGYERDNTDMDFIRYQIGLQMQARRAGDARPVVRDLLDHMPANRLAKCAFRNLGDDAFADSSAAWGFDEASVSAGAVYADLDNDGAPDLVVSNINEPVFVYRNLARKNFPDRHYLRIRLRGAGQNTMAIGARVTVHAGTQSFLQELFPVRGFQSSVDPVLDFGLGADLRADSVCIAWPDGRTRVVKQVAADQTLVVTESGDDPLRAEAPVSAIKPWFAPEPPFPWRDRAGDRNDFNQQPLLPGFCSDEGPCLALSGDRLFVGGRPGAPGRIFEAVAEGWRPTDWLSNAPDSAASDADAIFFDANGDGYADLYISSGNYQSSAGEAALEDRLYLSDSRGRLRLAAGALPPMRWVKSCVREADANGDGNPDLFVGGGVVPGAYPLASPSVLLLGDGRGHFRAADSAMMPGITRLGLVRDARWADLNGDGWPDLVVASAWQPLRIFINHRGRFADETAAWFPGGAGWWNVLLAADLDGDGFPDLVAGNQGTNNFFHATPQMPVTLRFGDFRGDGRIDALLLAPVRDTLTPVYPKDDLTDRFPTLRKKFLAYNKYADATFEDLFGAAAGRSNTLVASEMRTLYLHNNGHGKFEVRSLPREAQCSPVFAIESGDYNGDGYTDLLLTGNKTRNRIRFGRYSANHGLVLLGDGQGNFRASDQAATGLQLRGDVRALVQRSSARGTELIAALYADSIKTYWQQNIRQK